MKIEDGCVVSLDFEMRSKGGDLIDSSSEEKPMLYLHGHQNLPEALEKALAGKQSGDNFDIKLSPQEAFGEHNPSLVQELPLSAVSGVEDLQEGMSFPAETDSGTLLLTVLEIKEDSVVLDANHPLAGEELSFKITVGDVRKATNEELEHGHAHGAGGHHHH